MRVYTPNPMVTLATHEIEDIVRQYLQNEIPGKRVGNLTGTDLEPLTLVSGSHTRLVGTITFELHPKDEK